MYKYAKIYTGGDMNAFSYGNFIMYLYSDHV